MTPKKRRPAGDSRSPNGAGLVADDQRILEQLESEQPKLLGIEAACNDPYAVAVWDDGRQPLDESNARFYRNRPSAGLLEFRETPEAEPMGLSNVTILLSSGLCFPLSKAVSIKGIGARDGDMATARSFCLSGYVFRELSWLADSFGPSAWYRSNLPGHVLEGWIVCSIAEALRKRV
jgi:hypothetical protein